MSNDLESCATWPIFNLHMQDLINTSISNLYGGMLYPLRGNHPACFLYLVAFERAPTILLLFFCGRRAIIAEVAIWRCCYHHSNFNVIYVANHFRLLTGKPRIHSIVARKRTRICRNFLWGGVISQKFYWGLVGTKAKRWASYCWPRVVMCKIHGERKTEVRIVSASDNMVYSIKKEIICKSWKRLPSINMLIFQRESY